MRSLRLVTLLLAVVVSSTARSQDLGTSTAPEPTYEDSRTNLPRFGVMADVGVPNGVGGSLLLRPMSWLRLHVGGSYNMVSSGVQAGLALIPFAAGPSLTIEAGHFFDGNANSLVQKMVGAEFQGSSMLQRVGYDYATAHAGLDFGTRRVTFYLHGGISYVRTTVHGAQDALQSSTDSGVGSDTQVVIKKDPIIRAFGPSLKLGLIVYIM